VVEAGPALKPGAPWPKAAWNVGEGRYAAQASEWPVRVPAPPLHTFLEYPPDPLSVRATAGFLRRADVSSLRFPEGFLHTVREHLAHMQRATS
jgi:DNA (cytosine-5)-methyltransferase 1